MKSYVREFVNEVASITEFPRRKDLNRGVIGIRLTDEDTSILKAIADKWGCSMSGAAAFLIEEAIKDAGEEAGVWLPLQEEEPVCEDTEE
jgi:hypothetical protein